jgi:hypothetical protein
VEALATAERGLSIRKGLAAKNRPAHNWDIGWPCALSSAVEHYLHTIKMAILASFSHLFLTLICIASVYMQACYIETSSEPMYAHKIPNFEIGLQVGCKFSVGEAAIRASVKSKMPAVYAAVKSEFHDHAFAREQASLGRSNSSGWHDWPVRGTIPPKRNRRLYVRSRDATKYQCLKCPIFVSFCPQGSDPKVP